MSKRTIETTIDDVFSPEACGSGLTKLVVERTDGALTGIRLSQLDGVKSRINNVALTEEQARRLIEILSSELSASRGPND